MNQTLRPKRFSAWNFCSIESGKKRNYRRLTSSSKQSHKEEGFEKFYSVFVFVRSHVMQLEDSISAKYLLKSSFDFQIFSSIKWQPTVFLSAIFAFEYSLWKYFFISNWIELCAAKNCINIYGKISAKKREHLFLMKCASVQSCWLEWKAAFCISMPWTKPNSIFHASSVFTKCRLFHSTIA